MTLASRLIQLQARIACSAQQYARDPSSISVLAVSKMQSVDAIAQAYASGLRAFGENYVQEAVAKMPSLPADIVWHCIGPLQSNKSKLVAEHFHWCQSVDSLKLATRLGQQRPAHLPPLQVCLQLRLGDEDSKSGLSADEIPALAHFVAGQKHLTLRGLMTIPPPSDEPGIQRHWFAQARDIYLAMQSDFPQVDTLSMGMSADLESAIAEGSTMIRVGTALFGARPPKFDSP